MNEETLICFLYEEPSWLKFLCWLVELSGRSIISKPARFFRVTITCKVKLIGVPNNQNIKVNFLIDCHFMYLKDCVFSYMCASSRNIGTVLPYSNDCIARYCNTVNPPINPAPSNKSHSPQIESVIPERMSSKTECWKCTPLSRYWLHTMLSTYLLISLLYH